MMTSQRGNFDEPKNAVKRPSKSPFERRLVELYALYKQSTNERGFGLAARDDGLKDERSSDAWATKKGPAKRTLRKYVAFVDHWCAKTRFVGRIRRRDHVWRSASLEARNPLRAY